MVFPVGMDTLYLHGDTFSQGIVHSNVMADILMADVAQLKPVCQYILDNPSELFEVEMTENGAEMNIKKAAKRPFDNKEYHELQILFSSGQSLSEYSKEQFQHLRKEQKFASAFSLDSSWNDYANNLADIIVNLLKK